MPYSGFWGLIALTLVLLGHSLYLWKTTTKGKALRHLPKIKKVQIFGLSAVCALVLTAGVVLMLCGADEAPVHVMGLALLLSAFGLNGCVRRCLPELIKKEEQEEENYE